MLYIDIYKQGIIKRSESITYYRIYPYKHPRGNAFFRKGGNYKKNQLSSPVAMGDNGHLQPSSRLPECIMVGELKILETNLKSEEIINFYFVFYRF